MAQTHGARSNNIIDLTEDDNPGLQNLSSAASRAQAAASRLNDHFQTLTSASRSRLPPNDYMTTGERILALREAGGNSLTGSHNAKGDTAPIPEPKAQTAANRASPARPTTPKTASNRDTDRLTPSRRPRAAAIDASRSITRDYDFLNPLEERLQASVTTPRKPGRPRKDEWTPTKKPTPKSGSSQAVGKSEEPGRFKVTRSRSPNARGLENHRTKGYSDDGPAGKTKDIPTLSKKRKHSSWSAEPESPIKLARTEGLQNLLPAITSASLEEISVVGSVPSGSSPQKTRSHQEFNQAENEHVRPTFTPQRVTTEPVSALAHSSTSNSGDNEFLTEFFSTVVNPVIEKAKKRHKGCLSEKELISIGKSVSHQSTDIATEGKRLNGRQVAVDVVKKDFTPFVSGSLSHPNNDQRKQIKRFVKKEFRQKALQQALASSANLIMAETTLSTSADNSGKTRMPPQLRRDTAIDNFAERECVSKAVAVKDNRQQENKAAKVTRITDLAGYLTILENETRGGESADSQEVTGYTGIVQWDTSKTTRQSHNSWAQSLTPTTHASVPTAALPTTVQSALATPAELSITTASAQPEFASNDSFPPGFDRGRYPMKRRKRGNKYYTPERKQKPLKDNSPKASPAAPQVSRHLSASTTSVRLTQPARVQEVPQSPQDRLVDREVTQLLVKRANYDRSLNDLLKLTASGKATKSQAVELDKYIDIIRARLTSGEAKSAEDPQLKMSNHILDASAGSVLQNEKDLKQSCKASSHRQKDSQDHKSLNGYRPNPHISARSGQNSVTTTSTQSNLKANRRILNTPPIRNFTSVNAQASRSSSTSNRVFTDLHALNDSVIEYPDSELIDHPRPRCPEALQQMGSSGGALPTKDHRPVHQSLTTALDPHFERLVADLLLNESDYPRLNATSDQYSIGYDEQEDLVDDPSLVLQVNCPPTKLVRIETKTVDRAIRPLRSSSSLLRHRELGSDPGGRYVNTQYQLRLRNAETIEPWRSWKGASGDVVAVAWAPDSMTYAVGAAAHTNVEDLQYNRPCNLLLGDLGSNVLTELPDHRVDRPKPGTIPSGPNATQAVYDACDPNVYETITSIAFAPTGSRMYTASHDRTVKIWDTSLRQCHATLRHDAWVTSIEASTQIPGLFATATKQIHDAIRVYRSQSSDTAPVPSCFSSSRAELRPDWQIYPECLRWGPTPYTSHLLLAGFHQWSEDLNGSGQIILWDALASESIKVSPSSQSVYAAAWHPCSSLFATGGAPSGLVTDKQSTKSVVRIWDLRTTKRYTMEYECSALDMQDVTFSPIDPNIVTAGCTDGASYVWDFRRPDRPLHRLQHGRPIVDWDHTRDREEVDTGVMMSLWGLGGTLFYSGSSDGMVKAWDIRRHPADVLVKNVAQFGAGVQSGALSPDGTNLLVGDADGGFHILSSAPCGPCDPNYDVTEEPIDLVRAPDGSGLKLESDGGYPGTEGREAGHELIRTGQLDYHPEFGITRGFYYRGPYARESREECSEPNKLGRLIQEYDKLQAFSSKGEERKEIARQRRGIIRARKILIDQELLRKQNSSSCDLETNGERDLTLKNAKISNVPGSETVFGAKNNVIPEDQMVEENHWWPRLGENEIAKAREKAKYGRG